MKNHTNSDDKTQIGLDVVEDEIKVLSDMRGDNRRVQIEKISITLYKTLKFFGYKTITKDFFNTLFADDIPTRTKQQISKEILSFMSIKKFIADDKIEIEKNYLPYSVKEIIDFNDEKTDLLDDGILNISNNDILTDDGNVLSRHYIEPKFNPNVFESKDDESQSILMSKNGFKSYCYKFGYDKIRQIPTRDLIGVYPINAIPDDVLIKADLIENKTNKSKDNIGVYSVVNKSLSGKVNKHERKAIRII